MAKLTPLAIAGIMAGTSALSVQTTPSFPNNGVSPAPTQAPEASDSLHHAAGLHELRRRAGTSVEPLTLLAAPDNTCGWVSGSVAVPYTCASGYSCGLVLAQSTASGGVMCYNAASYNFRFACYDYKQYFSSTMCDHLCAENAFYLKCTNALYPYCGTISFSSGITDYFCNSIEYSTPQVASTTWVGETDKRSYSRIVQSDFASTSINLSSAPSNGVPAPTVASDAKPAASASSSSSSDSSSSGGGGGSKTNVGAIVGGVVGGVAAIGIAVLAILFFLRRKRKNQGTPEKTASSTDQSPMPPGAQMSHQSYYDGSQTGYPPQQPQYMQTSPSPNQGYYPQGNTPPMHNNTQSPTASHMTDPRMSQATTSPAPTWSPTYGSTPPPNQYQQQQQPVPFQPGGPQGHPQQPVHEAPVDSSDQHRGEMHEMG